MIQTTMFPELAPEVDSSEVRYHPLTGRPIRGSYSAHRRCDDRCLYAKGPDCECQCGGINHGTGWREVLAQLTDQVTR